jgi:hypothetical protein
MHGREDPRTGVRMSWEGWDRLLGPDLVEAARACPNRVSSLADLQTFRAFRGDVAAGLAWIQGLPLDRLAGLLDTVTGRVRADLVEAWEVAENEAQ